MPVELTKNTYFKSAIQGFAEATVPQVLAVAVATAELGLPVNVVVFSVVTFISYVERKIVLNAGSTTSLVKSALLGFLASGTVTKMQDFQRLVASPANSELRQELLSDVAYLFVLSVIISIIINWIDTVQDGRKKKKNNNRKFVYRKLKKLRYLNRTLLKFINTRSNRNQAFQN